MVLALAMAAKVIKRPGLKLGEIDAALNGGGRSPDGGGRRAREQRRQPPARRLHRRDLDPAGVREQLAAACPPDWCRRSSCSTRSPRDPRARSTARRCRGHPRTGRRRQTGPPPKRGWPNAGTSSSDPSRSSPTATSSSSAEHRWQPPGSRPNCAAAIRRSSIADLYEHRRFAALAARLDQLGAVDQASAAGAVAAAGRSPVLRLAGVLILLAVTAPQWLLGVLAIDQWHPRLGPTIGWTGLIVSWLVLSSAPGRAAIVLIARRLLLPNLMPGSNPARSHERHSTIPGGLPQAS